MNIGDVITTADDLTTALDEDDRIWTQGVTGDTPWDRTAWTFASNENSDWWALRLPQEDDPPECVDGVFIPLRKLPLPVTIVATSANLPRPERVVKAEALREYASSVANECRLKGFEPEDARVDGPVSEVINSLLRVAQGIEAGGHL